MPDSQDFAIPDPIKPDPESSVDQQLLVFGALEQKELTEQFPEKQRHYNWVMRFVMKPALFLFVLWLNAWWDENIIHIV